MQKAFPARLRSGKSWDCRPLLEFPISKTYWERAACQDGRGSAGWDGGLGMPCPQSCPGNEWGWLWDVHRNLAQPRFTLKQGFCSCSSSLQPGCSVRGWKLPIGVDKMSSKPNPQTKQVLVYFPCVGMAKGSRMWLKPLPSHLHSSGFVIHIPRNYFVAIAILFCGPNPFPFTGKPFTLLSQCSGAFTLASYLSNYSSRLHLLFSTNLDWGVLNLG